MSRLRAALPASVAIVEDAACASGASYDGKPAGSIGEVGCFSFHPRKAITTGEGGMLTTDREDIAAKAAVLRSHGASASKDTPDEPDAYLPPDFDEVGFNYRMTDVQASIGLVQLRKLDRFIAEREKKAQFYREALADINWLRMPAWPERGTHAWQAYVTYVDPKGAPLSRNALMARLHERGISTRPGTHAVHMLGYYRNRLGLKPDDMPGARDCDRNTLAIPLHNRMSDDDYEYVVDCLREIARKA
jgi:perosamine synthetase